MKSEKEIQAILAGILGDISKATDPGTTQVVAYLTAELKRAHDRIDLVTDVLGLYLEEQHVLHDGRFCLACSMLRILDS